jgi:hypothetical protein
VHTVCPLGASFGQQNLCPQSGRQSGQYRVDLLIIWRHSQQDAVQFDQTAKILQRMLEQGFAQDLQVLFGDSLLHAPAAACGG